MVETWEGVRGWVVVRMAKGYRVRLWWEGGERVLSDSEGSERVWRDKVLSSRLVER